MKSHILFISLADLGSNNGDGIHSKKLLSYLERDYTVSSITLTKHFHSVRHRSLRTFNNILLRHVSWNIEILKIFLRLNSKSKIDLVYFREASIVFMPFILRYIYSCKLFLEINGITLHDIGINQLIGKRVFGLFYNISDHIIASSGYIKYISHHFLIPPSKTVPVSLGYHTYINVPPKEICFKNNFLSNKYKYLIFIGNVSEYQGLQYIIPVLSNISIPIKLLIIGNGSYEKNIQQMISHYNVEDFVILIDKLPMRRLAEYLNIADLAISPFSPNRGLPGTISGLKTFDYLFFKIPILTSIMDDKAEMIMEHALGDVIKTYEPSEIVMLIEQLLSDKKLLGISESYEKYYPIFIKHYSWQNRFSTINSKIYEFLKT